MYSKTNTILIRVSNIKLLIYFSLTGHKCGYGLKSNNFFATVPFDSKLK